MSALEVLAGRLLDAVETESFVELRHYGQGNRTLVRWRHLPTGGWSDERTPDLSVSSETLAAELSRFDESEWVTAVWVPRSSRLQRFMTRIRRQPA